MKNIECFWKDKELTEIIDYSNVENCINTYVL